MFGVGSVSGSIYIEFKPNFTHGTHVEDMVDPSYYTGHLSQQ